MRINGKGKEMSVRDAVECALESGYDCRGALEEVTQKGDNSVKFLAKLTESLVNKGVLTEAEVEKWL